MIDFEKLRTPFDPARVSWRVGSTNQEKTSGLALAYIDARDVMERLDEAVGQFNWSCRYTLGNPFVVCDLGLRHETNAEFVWKADGAGETDVEGVKGALSDALKRAAVRWGIGRYLYDLESPWVRIEPAGRSYRIAREELPRLRALLGRAPKVSTGNGVVVPQASGPEKWVDARLAEIKQLGSVNELQTWEAGHTELIERLRVKDDKLAQKINRALIDRMTDVRMAG